MHATEQEFWPIRPELTEEYIAGLFRYLRAMGLSSHWQAQPDGSVTFLVSVPDENEASTVRHEHLLRLDARIVAQICAEPLPPQEY